MRPFINIEKLNVKAFMSSFDSSSFQSKMQEIADLYEELDVSRKEEFNSFTKDEKLTVFDTLENVMKRIDEVYNDLSAHDNPEANEMKETIAGYADTIGYSIVNINSTFGSISNLINYLRSNA